MDHYNFNNSRINNTPEERNMYNELREAGFKIDTLQDIFKYGNEYHLAIPILAKWLPLLTDNDVKEDVVRKLSVPWAKGKITDLLIAEFCKLKSEDMSLQWAIGNALYNTAIKIDLPKLRELANNPEYVMSRQMIVLALGKRKDKESCNVLIKLLDQPEVLGHALWSLGMMPSSLD